MVDFEEIYDLALMEIVDYRLDKVANIDEERFMTVLLGWLTRGILEFSIVSETPLDYVTEEVTEDDGEIRTKYYFVNDLQPLEKLILADLLVINWFENIVQDVTQLNTHLSTKDFKSFSEANNLKQKTMYLRELRSRYEANVKALHFSNLTYEDLY